MRRTTLGKSVLKKLLKISRDDYLACFATIPFLGFVAYYVSNIQNFYFRSDDLAHLYINSHRVNLLTAFLYSEQFISNPNLYRPTTNIFFYLNQLIFHFNAFFYSLEMLILAALIFLFCCAIFNHYINRKYLSILLATTFVISPLMIEPITWYANICDTFAVLFSLIAIFLFLISKKKTILVVFSAGFLFLGLISKEVVFALLPYFMLLIFLSTENSIDKIKKSLLYIIPGITYVLIRFGYARYIRLNSLVSGYTSPALERMSLYSDNLLLLLKRLFFIPDNMRFSGYLVVLVIILLCAVVLISVPWPKMVSNKASYLATTSLIIGSIAINVLSPYTADRYLVFVYLGMLLLFAITLGDTRYNINFFVIPIVLLLAVNSYFFTIRFQGVTQASTTSKLYLQNLTDGKTLYDVPNSLRQIVWLPGGYRFAYVNLIYSEPTHVSMACNMFKQRYCGLKQGGSFVIEKNY